MTSAVSAAPHGIAKLAMQAFLGLLIVNALVAIAAIMGATGDSDWEVVGTTLLLTAGCLTVAANAAALERKRLQQLPYVGAATSCVAFAVMIAMIWIGDGTDNDFIVKSTFILLTIGLASTYASVLAMPPLDGVFATARGVGYATVGVLAAMTVAFILAESGASGQVYAVLSVVLATATIIVLTGAVIESRKPDAVSSLPAAASGAHRGLRCPACGSVVGPTVVSGTHTCGHCGLGFALQITSPPTGQHPWMV